MDIPKDIRDTVLNTFDDVRAYLASDEGRRLRGAIATGMIVAAPAVARLPVFRASFLGRVLGLAGGAALVVKAAEMLRDWDPQPLAARVGD